MMENIKINCHSSIKIINNKTIYIDPFRINEVTHDADYIFVTHSHYDHFSTSDILKVAKIDTVFIATEDTKTSFELMGVPEEQIIIVKPNNSYKTKDISFETVYAYNKEKKFHPKENNWVGYVINLNNTTYYIAGDTDNIEEIQNIKCDIAFLPIGGTYTMNAKEAAELANKIECKKVVPIHYGEIVGTQEDLKNFIELTKREVEVLIK